MPSSIPTDSRTRLSGTSSGEPAAEAWVIAPGCSMRLSTAPSDSASVKISVEAATRIAASLPAASVKETMPPKSRHLLGRRGVSGVVGQLRIEHALDGGVTAQQVDDGAGVLAVPVHADGERLHAAEDEIAVER